MFHRKKKRQRQHFGEKERDSPTAAAHGLLNLKIYHSFSFPTSFAVHSWIVWAAKSDCGEKEKHIPKEKVKEFQRFSSSTLLNLEKMKFRSLPTITVNIDHRRLAFNTHLTNQRISLNLESRVTSSSLRQFYFFSFSLSSSSTTFDYLIWLGRLLSLSLAFSDRREVTSARTFHNFRQSHRSLCPLSKNAKCIPRQNTEQPRSPELRSFTF